MDIDLLKRDQDSFIYGHDDEPDYNEDHTKFDHFSNNFDNFYFENIPPHQRQHQQHSEHDSIKHVIIEENKLSPSTLNVEQPPVRELVTENSTNNSEDSFQPSLKEVTLLVSKLLFHLSQM